MQCPSPYIILQYDMISYTILSVIFLSCEIICSLFDICLFLNCDFSGSFTKLKCLIIWSKWHHIISGSQGSGFSLVTVFRVITFCWTLTYIYRYGYWCKCSCTSRLPGSSVNVLYTLKRWWTLFSFSFFFLLSGIPLNKPLYTISYMLLASACAGITFSSIYVLVSSKYLLCWLYR